MHESKSVIRLEWKLRKELEEVLSREELLWYKKSRKEWISHGDHNTSFFHQKPISRRKKNRITAIKNDNNDIKAHAINFFSALYTAETDRCHPYLLMGCFPSLDTSMLHLLQAPGVDGLHAIFCQSQWSIVGDSFCRSIKNIFATKHIPTEINRTLLVLILKNDSPISLRMNRPISLCTVVYKTVTKMVANKLQNIVTHLILTRRVLYLDIT